MTTNKLRISALAKPDPPQVRHVTHHSVELHWEETLDAANAAIGDQSGDNRTQVVLQQLSPGIVESWQEVYSGYGKEIELKNLSSFSQYKFRIKFQWRDDDSMWSRATLCTTHRDPLNGVHLHKAVASGDITVLRRVLNTRMAFVDSTNRYDFTPLMEAARLERIQMMADLVENGATVDFQNDAGKTALMLVASLGKSNPVQELRRLGASYDRRDSTGSTALHWACISKNPELVDWMINDGADVSVTNDIGRTPLMLLASVEDRHDIAAVLLRHGAKVNQQDKHGQTALTFAVYNGFHRVAQVLLHYNADISVKNQFGRTIKDIALASDKKALVECFHIYLEKLEQTQLPQTQLPETELPQTELLQRRESSHQ